MSPAPATCLCLADNAWMGRPEDDFCALCGRRLVDVRHKQPILQDGPPPVIAVYLQTKQHGRHPARVWGLITLELLGAQNRIAKIVWTPASRAPLLRVRRRRTPPSSLHVQFETEVASVPSPGPFGGGYLTVRLGSVSFAFEIRAFVIPHEVPRPWIALQRGAEPEGPELVVYRGAERGRTFLHFRLADDVPIRWERVECNHPAAAVRAVLDDPPTPIIEAAVDWDPYVLSPEERRETVAFCLRLAGLPSRRFPYHQPVRWRLERALRFEPVGLILPVLCAGRPEFRAIKAINQDREPLTIDRVESTCPWITISAIEPPVPVLLAHQGSVSVQVRLDSEAISDQIPPYQGNIHFDFGELGSQDCPVVVETVRRVQTLPGPLLIDAGPPTIVLARIDPEDGRISYLPCSGNAGVTAVRLGLSSEEYARAAYAGQNVEALLPRLIEGARQLIRREDQYEAESVLLCNHPWIPEGVVGGADWVWLALGAAQQNNAVPGASILLRLDAWSTTVATLGPNGPRRVQRTKGLAESLGSAIVIVLMELLGEPIAEGRLLVEQAQAVLSKGSPISGTLWILTAIEGLLHDYRWGESCAWHRLLAVCWRHFPRSRRRRLDIAVADARLRREVRRSMEKLLPRLVRTGASCILTGALFASPPLRAEVQTASASLGIAASCLAADWPEWLAASVRALNETE